MRKAKKLWLIAAAVLTAAGLILFFGALAAVGFDFTKLSTVRYTENAYTADSAFDRIAVDTDTADIAFAPSADGQCRIDTVETERLRFSIDVQDGTLRIGTVDTRTLADRIGIDFGNAKATVFLPQSEYASLTVHTGTGDVLIPQTLTIGQIGITGDTSDIVCAAAVTEGIRVQTSTGDVLLTDAACGNAAVQTTTGAITLRGVTASEGFLICSDTGDVLLEDCDAAEIDITTNTGDVTGTLRTDKTFRVETSTGDVRVPQGTTGGSCAVRTDTGDVLFR